MPPVTRKRTRESEANAAESPTGELSEDPSAPPSNTPVVPKIKTTPRPAKKTRKDSASSPPDPVVVIDHTAFPHIIDEIMSSENAWVAFYGASREYHSRISAMFRRLVVTQVADPASSSRELVVSSTSPSFLNFSIKNPSKKPWKAQPMLRIPAAFFKQLTRVLELPFCDMSWFQKEKGPQLDTLRIYPNTDNRYRLPNYFARSELPRWPFVSAKKVVLFPHRPGETVPTTPLATRRLPYRDTHLYPYFIAYGLVDKIVCHVVCHQNVAEFMSRTSDYNCGSKQLVYIFSYAHETIESDAYDVLMYEIAEEMYQTYLEMLYHPEVYFVNLLNDGTNISCQGFLDKLRDALGSRCDWMVLEDLRNGFGDTECCSECGEYHDQEDWEPQDYVEDYLDRVMAGIKFMTRESYAASLAPWRV